MSSVKWDTLANNNTGMLYRAAHGVFMVHAEWGDVMTLKEYLKNTGLCSITLKTSAVQVFTRKGAEYGLYHLEDYVVSSAVSGPSVILVKRE